MVYINLLCTDEPAIRYHGQVFDICFFGGVYPIVDNCVCKDFYPADRLIHDITLALMATQTTEGGLDTFHTIPTGAGKEKSPASASLMKSGRG